MATSSSLICLSFFLLFSTATCFNITRLLDTYPDFKTFNDYLTQTKLNDEINKRQTITVLAVANDAMGGVQGSTDVIKRVMSLHVILDYYDGEKLSKLSKNTALLTTLYQSSGIAENKLGFLNVTKKTSGEIVFGSAEQGAQLNSKLVKKVAAQPYNISVLQISSPIYPDGLQNAGAPKTAPTPPPPSSPKKAPSPKSSKASPPEAEAPEPAAEADAPTSDAPASDTPASSPPAPVADEPAADAQAPADAKSSAGRVTVGACVGPAMVVVSSLFAL